jgi:hypothetical protein
LAKIECHHGSAFTLYPPGYAPYARRSAAPVGASGEIVFIGEGEEAVIGEAESTAKPAWCRTLFVAALDAARGDLWSRLSPPNDSRRRRTQGRYLLLAAALLGLTTDLDEAIAQRIADCLGIAYVLLSDQRNVYQPAFFYKDRGAAIVSVLKLIPIDRDVAHRLNEAGYNAGLWGQPKRLEPG